jgi:protein O-mannosyl-transferase
MSVRGLRVSPTVLCAVLLFVGTFLLFARSARYGFLDYDDPRYILNNTAIQAGFDAESLRWAFAGEGDIWAPVVRLTHILDVQLFGLQATGHHLHSILWHSLNAALAFLLLRRLTGAFWTSALCAALFAWHPLRVESVTWISERKDVVSVAFGLLTLLAYTAYAERRAAGERARRHFALALLAFAAALLSKPSMVALPGVLLLLDFWPLGRWSFAPAPASGRPGVTEPTTRLLLEKTPFVALAALCAFITVRTQTAAGDFVLDLPLGARLANAVVSLPRYLGKFFWPFDLSTSYSHPGWWPLPALAAAALAVAAVGIVAWKTRRTMPWIAVGCLWFFGALLPMIGIVQVGFQSIADRYTYFPMLGWQIALLWTARATLAPRTPRWALAALAGIVLVACGARTWHQQGYWRDPITLTRQGVAAAPDSPVAHAFLAYTYAIDTRHSEARAECERALALDPRNAVAVQVLAEIEATEGHGDAAVARYRSLLALEPANTAIALEFANYLLSLRRLDEAEAIFHPLRSHPEAGGVAQLGLALIAYGRNEHAAALDLLRTAHSEYPDCVPVIENLTGLLHATGCDEEAASLFSGAIARSPRSADLLHAHATFLRATGKLDDAIGALDRAIARRPHDPALRHERAQLLVASGRTDEALLAYVAILKENPDYVPAAFESGLLYEKRGDSAQAAALYRRAVAARPAFVPAQLAIARLAETEGRTAEADAAFAAALAAQPKDPVLHRSFAEVLARRRNFADALVHYRESVELAPSDAASRAGLGYVLFLTGNRTEAASQWAEALRLQPDFPGLRDRLAKIRTATP